MLCTVSADLASLAEMPSRPSRTYGRLKLTLSTPPLVISTFDLQDEIDFACVQATRKLIQRRATQLILPHVEVERQTTSSDYQEQYTSSSLLSFMFQRPSLETTEDTIGKPRDWEFYKPRPPTNKRLVSEAPTSHSIGTCLVLGL